MCVRDRVVVLEGLRGELMALTFSVTSVVFQLRVCRVTG